MGKNAYNTETWLSPVPRTPKMGWLWPGESLGSALNPRGSLHTATGLKGSTVAMLGGELHYKVFQQFPAF